VIEEARNHKP